MTLASHVLAESSVRVVLIGGPNRRYMRLGSGMRVGPKPRIRGDGHIGTSEQLLPDELAGSAQQAVSPNRCVVDIVATNGRGGHNRIAVRDRQSGKAATPLPVQLVLLAFELGHLASAAREDQHRFPVGHQGGAIGGRTDDGAGCLEDIRDRTGHSRHRFVGKASDPDSELPVHDIRDHHRLGHGAHNGVVSDQEEAAVARQILEPVDIRASEIDERVQAIGTREDRFLPSGNPGRLINRVSALAGRDRTLRCRTLCVVHQSSSAR
nr:hypothetical protein [Arthrobacter sp. SLBN-53]